MKQFKLPQGCRFPRRLVGDDGHTGLLRNKIGLGDPLQIVCGCGQYPFAETGLKGIVTAEQTVLECLLGFPRRGAGFVQCTDYPRMASSKTW